MIEIVELCRTIFLYKIFNICYYNKDLFQYFIIMYTNKSINIISLILTCIIFFILNFFIFDRSEFKIEKISNIIINIKKDIENEVEDDKQKIKEKIDLGNWYIEIPAINLQAPIAEGTDSHTLNTKVGHFTETAIEDGNIGLAAHNRGYEYNFFENLKEAKIDDEIIYTHENYKKTYIIDKIEIIENTDWSYLENYDENKITLITCVENEPKYRRCVQATEL